MWRLFSGEWRRLTVCCGGAQGVAAAPGCGGCAHIFLGCQASSLVVRSRRTPPRRLGAAPCRSGRLTGSGGRGRLAERKTPAAGGAIYPPVLSSAPALFLTQSRVRFCEDRSERPAERVTPSDDCADFSLKPHFHTFHISQVWRSVRDQIMPS